MLLYFGSSMLLFFPYYSGVSHLFGKLVYGVLPATARPAAIGTAIALTGVAFQRIDAA